MGVTANTNKDVNKHLGYEYEPRKNSSASVHSTPSPPSLLSLLSSLLHHHLHHYHQQQQRHHHHFHHNHRSVMTSFFIPKLLPSVWDRHSVCVPVCVRAEEDVTCVCVCVQRRRLRVHACLCLLLSTCWYSLTMPSVYNVRMTLAWHLTVDDAHMTVLWHVIPTWQPTLCSYNRHSNIYMILPHWLHRYVTSCVYISYHKQIQTAMLEVMVLYNNRNDDDNSIMRIVVIVMIKTVVVITAIA